MKIPLLGSLFEPKEAIIQFVMTNIGIIILYFLTKWGNEYFQKALANEKRSTELLEQLKNTFRQIGQASTRLNEQLAYFMKNIEGTSKNSDTVAKGILDMAKGISDEASAISEISGLMTEAMLKLQYVNEHFEAIEELSNQVKTSLKPIVRKLL